MFKSCEILALDDIQATTSCSFEMNATFMLGYCCIVNMALISQIVNTKISLYLCYEDSELGFDSLPSHFKASVNALAQH